MYFIIPIIPPNISFNFIPIIPDFPYIKTHNNILNIINATIAKSMFDALFLALLLVFFLLFLLAILSLPFFYCKSDFHFDVSFKKCPNSDKSTWDMSYWDTFCPLGTLF